MSNHELLDNITHKNLRVITDRSARYGDDVAWSGVFPIEFRRVQADYPIVFLQDEHTGVYEPLAMFGLVKNENLFLDETGWNASYIPLSIERKPFLIGFEDTTAAGVPTEKPVIYVDMGSPRLSETVGEAVFLEHGGSSPYLQHINSVLLAIHEGHEQNRRFSEALSGFELLEPFAMNVQLNDGSKYRLENFYTINEEHLNGLSRDSLATLHEQGDLERIYMLVASLSNFATLVRRKNALLC